MGETVWLSAGQLAELFQRDKSTISRYIQNVYGGLKPTGTVALFAKVLPGMAEGHGTVGSVPVRHMNRQYLGDSYDAVKRLWREALARYAPLHAEPRFIPEELRTDYTKATLIPILGIPPDTPYSILNDPDTGIVQPGTLSCRKTHIRLEVIVEQLGRPLVQAVITFDQSIHRSKSLNREGQLKAKMRRLTEAGVCSFYYDSHAPFLFASGTVSERDQVVQRLIGIGIPRERLDFDSER
jgi:hypothetical protein